jgi:hypothetical protein
MTNKSAFNRLVQNACSLRDKKRYQEAVNELLDAERYCQEPKDVLTYQLEMGINLWFLAEKRMRLGKNRVRDRAVQLFQEVINSKVNSPVEKDRAHVYLSVYYFIKKDSSKIILAGMQIENKVLSEVQDLYISEYALLRAVQSLVEVELRHTDKAKELCSEAKEILERIPAKHRATHQYATEFYSKATNSLSKLYKLHKS